jgi:hypothetical protein
MASDIYATRLVPGNPSAQHIFVQDFSVSAAPRLLKVGKVPSTGQRTQKKLTIDVDEIDK